MLSLHPRYECNTRDGTLTETDELTTSQLITGTTTPSDDDQDRTESDLDIYTDMLLLIDTLERHDPVAFDHWETLVLINLYTLLSDVQRNAGDLRTVVREVLLDRLHHDQPVYGQYGSVQRTTRRNRSLKDDGEVLCVLEDECIPHERVMAVDREKIDEALAVAELADSAVYDIDKREYVRKADVNEEIKECRLQGLNLLPSVLATLLDDGVKRLGAEHYCLVLDNFL